MHEAAAFHAATLTEARRAFGQAARGVRYRLDRGCEGPSYTLVTDQVAYRLYFCICLQKPPVRDPSMRPHAVLVGKVSASPRPPPVSALRPRSQPFPRSNNLNGKSITVSAETSRRVETCVGPVAVPLVRDMLVDPYSLGPKMMCSPLQMRCGSRRAPPPPPPSS